MKPIQHRRVHPVVVRLAILGCLVAAVPASAQIGFEAPDYEGSAKGLRVAGQQGWYVPPVPGSVDQFVYTYEGNGLSLPANAFGEDQFLGARVPQVGDLARAQLNFDWSAATVWTVSYDVAARFNGTLPAANNLGSFSLQDSTIARYFIALNIWADKFSATQWHATYLTFTADGTMVLDPQSPGLPWQNLAVDHWYRLSTTFDFDSNSILSVSITDLDSGDTASFEPTGWYLAGGATGRPPLPTALRFFVGGDAAPGNVQGWDNLLIEAVASPNGTGEESRPQPFKLTPGSITN